MRLRLLAATSAFLILLSGCGPSPEESAIMTQESWTPTPQPTPTATPIPYDLIVHIFDENGGPIPEAAITVADTPDAQPFAADATGVVTINNLPSPSVSLRVSAPGYIPALQTVMMQRGPNEMALNLRPDPFGLVAANACAPSEQLLYMEDFQDNKAQGWREITAATEFGAENGWSIAPVEEGNFAATFTGPHEDLDDLEGQTFDNVVWRLKVRTHGTDGFSFLNLRRATKADGETRYPLQWGASVLTDLTRLDTPDVGHLDVSRSSMRLKQDRWYYFEISYFQGNIQVWVDGKKIIDYTDPQPLPPGMISMEAHVPNDPNTTYAFDDLSVCGLSGPFSTSLYKPPAQ
jgi:hypothetical protein